MIGIKIDSALKRNHAATTGVNFMSVGFVKTWLIKTQFRLCGKEKFVRLFFPGAGEI